MVAISDTAMYHKCGTFDGDFNLAVWQICLHLPNQMYTLICIQDFLMASG